MTQQEFMQHLSLLQQRDFELYPDPKGIDRGERKFRYVDDTPTHVKIQNVITQKEYLLSLSLIELINPGIMRLYREVRAFNGSFV